MKNIITLSIIALLIIGYFSFIYHLNNRQNIIKRTPKSIFQSEAETLHTTITLYPTLPTQNVYNTTTTDLLTLSFNFPDTWSVDNKTTNNTTVLNLHSDNNPKECVNVYVQKDDMPLLEAVNYNRYMLQAKNKPYRLSEPVETNINSIPTHISKLHFSTHNPDKMIRNAVMVKENTFTVIVRSCENTPEDMFFSIIKTIQLS